MVYPFSPQRENEQPAQLNSFKDDISVSNPNKDFARWHLSNDDMLDELRHILAGEVKIAGKWSYLGKRLMNEDGVRQIVTTIYSHANKFVFLSKLTQDDIMDLMLHLDDAVITYLELNFLKYEIDEADLDLIRSIIITICYAGMTRGLDGWTMEQTGTSMTSREFIMPNQQHEKKGFLGGWFK